MGRERKEKKKNLWFLKTASGKKIGNCPRFSGFTMFFITEFYMSGRIRFGKGKYFVANLLEL